ncbi:MAG TPA: DUF2272 domain-containing protein [Beijerinckiaceae bacterium]
MPATADAIITAAISEWKHWGKSTWNCINGAKTIGYVDDDKSYAQYVIDNYCALFYKKPIKWPTVSTIANDDYYWSAVTISYIMRTAGYSKKEFPISESHSDYIRWSIAAKNAKDAKADYWGYRADDKDGVPEPGDLIGYPRAPKLTKKKALAFYNATASYGSHTDIVVAKRPGEIDVIGGNVMDSVTMKTLAISSKGLLADTEHFWFVVMKKRS